MSYMVKREKSVTFRVTEQAWSAYCRLAKLDGLRVSAWVRKVLAERVRSAR